MDIKGLKGRVAEAFVENVFRESGYKVSRLGRESHPQQLFKTGKSEFLPDFFVWKSVDRSSDGSPLHRLVCVEVKYRSNVDDFLRRFGPELLSYVGEDWPELYVVIVTDRPDSGRSCFQLLDICRLAPDEPLETTDLHTASELGISQTTCEEYEDLVRGVFSNIGAHAFPRKPPAKVMVPDGLSIPERSSAPGVTRL